MTGVRDRAMVTRKRSGVQSPALQGGRNRPAGRGRGRGRRGRPPGQSRGRCVQAPENITEARRGAKDHVSSEAHVRRNRASIVQPALHLSGEELNQGSDGEAVGRLPTWSPQVSERSTISNLYQRRSIPRSGSLVNSNINHVSVLSSTSVNTESRKRKLELEAAEIRASIKCRS